MGFFSILILLLLYPPITAYPYKRCEGNNFSTNTTFESNLNLLLSSLSSTDSTFATNTTGSAPDTVYSLFLCRGDVNHSSCHNCIQTSMQNILKLCPYSKQATVWYETCQLRYSDLSINSLYYDGEIVKNSDIEKEKEMDPDAFNKLRGELLDKLSWQAARNSTLMFATGAAAMIYGLVQCTRDLSGNGCQQCLQEIIMDSLRYLDALKGRIILAKSCNFRYEVYKFFEGVPDVLLSLPPNLSDPVPSPPPNLIGKDGGKGNRNTIIITIVIIAVVSLVLISAVCIFFWKRSTKNRQGIANPEKISSIESLYFDLNILKVATDNFSDVNKLGQGGFGAVYKGMLPNGEDVAVKRLSANSRQGIEELKNELLLVAKLQHRNLVRLQGVCLEGGEKLLVYEYMPNGSLEKCLFDPIKSKGLDWERRLKIIGGIARGLLYLHEEARLKVIHRDLKASNVLLDANMKPKISDFGLARLFGDETHGVTSRVVGTFGYMPPEYARHGRFSTKLDVYSYGILVLEIVTGRKNSNLTYDSDHGQDLPSYTWKHWRTGTAAEIIDPSLRADYSRNEVFRCIQIALLCSQEVPDDRPSMSSVFLMLNSPSMPLQDPSPPYFAKFSMADSDVS